MCTNPPELMDEIKTAVVHEVVRHFDIDDGRLHGLS